MRKIDKAFTKRLTSRGKRAKTPKLTAMRAKRIAAYRAARRKRSELAENVAERARLTKKYPSVWQKKKAAQKAVVSHSTKEKTNKNGSPAIKNVYLRKPKSAMSFVSDDIKKSFSFKNSRVGKAIKEVKDTKKAFSSAKTSAKKYLKGRAISYGMQKFIDLIKRKKKKK